MAAQVLHQLLAAQLRHTPVVVAVVQMVVLRLEVLVA